MRGITQTSILCLIVLLIQSCGSDKNDSAALKMKEGYINHQGTKVWYQLHSSNAGTIPVIVIHGGPGGNYFYLKPIEELAKDRSLIFYDQSGCGNSDSLTDTTKWNLDYFTDELKLLIDSLNFDEVILLGQSWGTTIATNYMIKYDLAKVAGLILSGPCLNAVQWAADQKKWIEEMPVKYRQAITNAETSGNFADSSYLDAVNEFYRLHVCRMEVWPDILMQSFERLNFNMYNHMWGPSEFSVRGNLRNLNLEPLLNEITVPVLITCGEFDEATPETCNKYAGYFNNAVVVSITGASHQHHMEEPEQYMNAVRDFIGSFEIDSKK